MIKTFISFCSKSALALKLQNKTEGTRIVFQLNFSMLPSKE